MLTILRKITKENIIISIKINKNKSLYINENYFLTFQNNVDFNGLKRYLQSNLPGLILNNIDLCYGSIIR